MAVIRSKIRHHVHPASDKPTIVRIEKEPATHTTIHTREIQKLRPWEALLWGSLGAALVETVLSLIHRLF
jgi:hypothetical protein